MRVPNGNLFMAQPVMRGPDSCCIRRSDTCLPDLAQTSCRRSTATAVDRDDKCLGMGLGRYEKLMENEAQE